jgi:hypothetical protein
MAAPAENRSVLGELGNKPAPAVVTAAAGKAALTTKPQVPTAEVTAAPSEQQLTEPLLDDNRDR